MRRAIVSLLAAPACVLALAAPACVLAFAAPACVLATDFDSFHAGASGGGDVDAGAESGITIVEAGADAGADAGNASAYAAAVAADSPLLYFRLGDPAGSGTAHDSSARQATATVLGTVTFGRPGALGGDTDTAIRLEGAGAIFVDAPTEFASNAPFSIEGWAMPITGMENDGSGHCIAATESGNNNGWALFYYQSRHPKLERESANADDVCETSVDSPGTSFTYIVGTYDGTKLRVYVNAVLEQIYTSAPPIPGNAGVPFVIGAGDDGTSNRFKGDLDEIAVYGVALSQDQIARHYRAAGH